MDENVLENPTIMVRRLRPADLDAVVQLDARVVGRSRGEYFKLKLDQALADTGIEVSLAAEQDDIFMGFLLARVYYGEFGSMERVAVLDTIGVHPDFRQRGVGNALVEQLTKNLHGLGITSLQTEVSWDDLELLAFFRRRGFTPAPRFCLDLKL